MEQIDPHLQLGHILRFLDVGLRVDTRHLTSSLYFNHIWSGSTDTTGDDHLPVYLARLCERWIPVIKGAIPERNADIVIRRYCLDGVKQSLLKELAETYGVGNERIRQLEMLGLNYLRKGGQRGELLQIALEVVSLVAPLDNGSWTMASYQ